MRSLLIASAGLVLSAGGVADAQRNAGRPGASYAVPGRAMQAPMATPRRPGPVAARPVAVNPVALNSVPLRSAPRGTQRWGSKIDGRWWAGANAPGGWDSYRRPRNGWAIPPYWNAPRFYVGDWSAYGLTRPLPGYNWVRYYDDAVLINPRGSVFGTVGGVDWDRDGTTGPDARYADDGPDHDGVYPARDDRGPPGAGYDVPRYRSGAAPRRDLPPPPPTASVGYDAGYAPRSGDRSGRGGTWVSPDGNTTITTTSGGDPYYRGGSTTVVVQSAPVVTTTTTTEYYDDPGRYRSAKRRRRAR